MPRISFTVLKTPVLTKGGAFPFPRNAAACRNLSVAVCWFLSEGNENNWVFCALLAHGEGRDTLRLLLLQPPAKRTECADLNPIIYPSIWHRFKAFGVSAPYTLSRKGGGNYRHAHLRDSETEHQNSKKEIKLGYGERFPPLPPLS